MQAGVAMVVMMMLSLMAAVTMKPAKKLYGISMRKPCIAAIPSTIAKCCHDYSAGLLCSDVLLVA